MNLTLYNKRDYEKNSPFGPQKTNPNKPNVKIGKMLPNSLRRKPLRQKPRIMPMKNKPKANPIKPKTNPIFKRPARVAQTPACSRGIATLVLQQRNCSSNGPAAGDPTPRSRSLPASGGTPDSDPGPSSTPPLAVSPPSLRKKVPVPLSRVIISFYQGNAYANGYPGTGPMAISRNAKLFSKAVRLIPGGVNSPGREGLCAFRVGWVNCEC